MTSPIPSYIPSPNWDIPFPSPSVSLGRLIKNYKDPESLIPSSTIRPIPPSAINISHKKSWHTTMEEIKAGHLGVWASFLQILLVIPPVGTAEVGLEVVRSKAEEHRFETLETHSFIPDPEYIRQAIADPGAQAFFEATGRRKPVYMITGIKVARGADVNRETATKIGVEAGIEADLTAVTMVPVTPGTGVGWQRGKRVAVGFAGGSDYVFAYRLIKIKLKRKGVVSERFAKGAVFGLDDELEDSEGEDFDVEEYDGGLGVLDDTVSD
ncbi:hypothetical protein OQA88_4636 [Cercophora sp. LCS_1]